MFSAVRMFNWLFVFLMESIIRLFQFQFTQLTINVLIDYNNAQ